MRNRIICMTIMFLSVSLCWGSSQGADKVITLQFSHFGVPGSTRSQLWEQWGKEVEQKSNGRVKVNCYPGSTLTPPSQTFDSVVKGVVDIGWVGTGATPGRFPMLEIPDLPYGIPDAVTGTKLLMAYINKFKPKELDQVKVLNVNAGGPMIIHSKKPIRTLEDLKGFKLRSPGGVTTDILLALGAVPMSIGPGDTYDAVQKGVAGGIVSGMDLLDAFKYGEVTGFSTSGYQTGIGGTSGFTIMNRKTFESLPPDVQKMIDSISPDYGLKMAKCYDDLVAQAIKNWTAKGHQFIVLSKAEDDRWAQRLAPIYDAEIKAKKGLPIAEAMAFCRDWVKKNLR